MAAGAVVGVILTCPQCKTGDLCQSRLGLLKRRLGSGQVCQICAKRIPGSEARWRCKTKCGFIGCSSCVGAMTGGKPASIRSSRSARKACKHGARCYDRSKDHLATYVHPGDRDYRHGRAVFQDHRQPELATLWQIFTFFDPEESGHLSQSLFHQAAEKVGSLIDRPLHGADEWVNAGGNDHGNVSFPRFCYWAARAGLNWLPVGLDPGSGGAEICRFVCPDGSFCGCKGFQSVPGVAGGDSPFCICGHRRCAHRTEEAERRLAQQLATCRAPHWQRGASGLVEVTDPSVLAQFQFLLDATHKETDNWTRDRGCAIHGINGCPIACANKNRQPVPTGYRLISLRRNQSPRLWFRFSLMRASVLQECALGDFKEEAVLTAGAPFKTLDSAPLADSVNEWRLFHGTNQTACEGICENNFNLDLVGTGSTWRDSSGAKGMPLYGHGIYFSERITKADEYAKLALTPGDSPNLCSVLVCRVVAGRVAVCTKNEIDAKALKQQVLGGPHHSILGDRVKELGKPYREMVIYDRDQVYPEFLLTYERFF